MPPYIDYVLNAGLCTETTKIPVRSDGPRTLANLTHGYRCIAAVERNVVPVCDLRNIKTFRCIAFTRLIVQTVSGNPTLLRDHLVGTMPARHASYSRAYEAASLTSPELQFMVRLFTDV